MQPMTMIERRVTELEQARGEFARPLVLVLHRGVLTPEQQRQKDEANRAGRLVVLVRTFCEPVASP
jgi:hypothetical protein